MSLFHYSDFKDGGSVCHIIISSFKFKDKMIWEYTFNGKGKNGHSWLMIYIWRWWRKDYKLQYVKKKEEKVTLKIGKQHLVVWVPIRDKGHQILWPKCPIKFAFTSSTHSFIYFSTPKCETNVDLDLNFSFR